MIKSFTVIRFPSVSGHSWGADLGMLENVKIINMKMKLVLSIVNVILKYSYLTIGLAEALLSRNMKTSKVLIVIMMCFIKLSIYNI